MTTRELPVLRTRGSWCAVEPAVRGDQAMATAELLRVLADPTRLAMLATLRAADQSVCVCDFVGAYDLTQPTISHHMGKLRGAGLVDANKEGLWTYYRAVEPLPRVVEAVLDALRAEKQPLQA
ncbi:MAG: ArsR/SmtB family transcription factor [Candidatus Dormibacteraceae bacterium]